MRQGKVLVPLSCGKVTSPYRIGTWATDKSGESSNWREFTNVVESSEDEAEGGRLENTPVYFFTDNSTTEAAVCKGISKSRKLLALAIRLKGLEARHSIHLVVCNVAGTPMIAEVGEGVSRGLLNEGVRMAGEGVLQFTPLHLSDKNDVTVALLGQVKGKHGEREYLLPTASTT
jgi:hypothetical protein